MDFSEKWFLEEGVWLFYVGIYYFVNIRVGMVVFDVFDLYGIF